MELLEPRQLLTAGLKLTGAMGQHMGEPVDTNADGATSPIDLLVVINALADPARDPLTNLRNHLFPDVNGDGVVSPRDLVLVAKELGIAKGGPGGGFGGGTKGHGGGVMEPLSSGSPVTITGPTEVNEHTIFTVSGHAPDAETIDFDVSAPAWAFVDLVGTTPGTTYDPLTGAYSQMLIIKDDSPPGTSQDPVSIIVTKTGPNAGSAVHNLTVKNVDVTATVQANSTEVDEGGTIQLDVTFIDATIDAQTITVNWGDGQSSVVQLTDWPPLPPGMRERMVMEGPLAPSPTTVPFGHQYLDDNPTGTPWDVYTITVTVSDNDTSSATAGTTVTVKNVAPTVTIDAIFPLDNVVQNARIDETEGFFVRGTVTDPGTLDTFPVAYVEADVNFDGVIDPANEWFPLTLNRVSSDRWEFWRTIPPVFDDGRSTDAYGSPAWSNETIADLLTIRVKVEDDDTGTGADSRDIDIYNVEPRFVDDPSVSGDEPCASFDFDQNGRLIRATAVGSFVDVGPLDHHRVSVEWGDGGRGDGTTNPIQLPLGDRSFRISREFDPLEDVSPDELYPIVFGLHDDDLGFDGTVCVAVHDPDVDIDVDSDNDDDIDENDDPATDKFYEERGPGKILAVGVNQRKEAKLKVDFPADVDPSTFTYTLVYDPATIEIFDKGPSDEGLPPTGTLIPPNTDITTVPANPPITVANLVAGLTVYMDGVNLGATDIVFKATRGPSVVSDKVRVTVALDLDTDSDNDTIVRTTSREEDNVEDWFSELGKRIFVNLDDDNKNGKTDKSDNATAFMGIPPEDDLAKVDIQFTQANLPGYKVVLEASSDLALYVTSGTLPTPVVITGDQGRTWTTYTWDLGPTTTWPGSLTVYAEGKGIGEGRLHWRFVKGGTILARDAVRVNVETIVWPFLDQPQHPTDWHKRSTEHWNGINVGPAWYINKRLVDYIMNPGDKGVIHTIYPDMDPQNGVPYASREGDASESKTWFGQGHSYVDGFTLEFDYSFQRDRNLPHGYVQGNAQPQKLSFVGNSGIKFGSHIRPWDGSLAPFEAAILDVDEYVAMAGGLGALASAISDAGMVDKAPYADEPLCALMTAVEYKGDYKSMADNPFGYPLDPPRDPANAGEFSTTLENNSNRSSGDNRMRVHVARVGDGVYDVEIEQNGQRYHREGIAVSGLNKFLIQAHWGSGVIFKNMNVTKD